MRRTSIMDIPAVAVLGASGVGKTSFIRQLFRLHGTERVLGRPLSPNDAFSLIEINGKSFRCTEVSSDFLNDRGEQLQVILSHQVFVIMYSVNDNQSFLEMERLKNAIQDTAEKPVRIIIVGNKLDTQRQMIASETADCLITIDWELPHVEISAKFALNTVGVTNFIRYNTLSCERKIDAFGARFTKSTPVVDISNINFKKRHNLAILSICQQHQERLETSMGRSNRCPFKSSNSRRKCSLSKLMSRISSCDSDDGDY